MKRDIRKAVEEIKSAGMEDFLHQDPSTFECDDDKFTHHTCTTGCKCTTGGKCPRTRCTRVKHCTFVTKCTHVKNGHLLQNVRVFAFKMDVRYESDA